MPHLLMDGLCSQSVIELIALRSFIKQKAQILADWLNADQGRATIVS